jgi:hypothetical protein
MSRHLFIFGFETPSQRANNARHGWDDEDSIALFIEAASADEALAWGHAVAHAYVAWRYAREGVSSEGAWSAEDHATWIETDPSARFSDEQLRGVKSIQVGQIPDFERMYGH